MMFSLVYIYYAYTGWNGASYLAGEIRDAQQNPAAGDSDRHGRGDCSLPGPATWFMLWPCSAGDVQAIVNAPENKEGLDVVAPIAEIAARRLFGPHWSNPLSLAIGLMLLSTLSAYLLLGPRVIYAMARAGQFPAIAARLTAHAGTPAVATALQVAGDPDFALDRLIRADRRLRQRGALHLLDAGHELDLRAPLEAARSSPTLPDARLPGHARPVYLVLTALLTGCGVLAAAGGFRRGPGQHPRRHPGLLPHGQEVPQTQPVSRVEE